MKTFVLHACAFLALSLPATAEVIGLELFEYPDGPIAGRAGGSLWDYQNFTPTGHTGTASTWDNVANAPIVAGNSALASPDLWGSPPQTSGVNLIGVIQGSGLSEGPTVLVGNPRLSPLGWFGGPTQTMHPLPGSPAVLSGSDTRTDQRGFTLTGPPTIGAVKLGQVVTVTNETELRNEMASSANTTGKVIRLDSSLSGQTLTLSGGQLSVPGGTNGLFIDGSSLPFGLTIDANGAVTNQRVLEIQPDATVALLGITLIGGKSTASTPDGGAIYNNRGTMSLMQCNLSGHSSSDNGGAIYNKGGNMSLAQCTLSDNTAYFGGAICNEGGKMSLAQCTLSDNSATLGGAIYHDSTMSLTRCSLSGNSASISGGEIYNVGLLALTQCTLLARHFDVIYPGILNDYDSILRLKNSIVAGQGHDGIFADIVNYGTVNCKGQNIVQTLDNNAIILGPIIAADPKLALLASNGGPTQTMALLPGSPALGAATGGTAATDQRGFPIVGTADLGAYESQGSTVTLTSSDNPSATGTSVTFTATVNELDPQTITPTGTVTFTVDSVNGSPVTLNGSGIATLTTSTLTAGSHTVTATYNGDARLLPSTSNTINQTVIDLTVVNGNDSGALSLRQALANAATHPGPDTITLPAGLNGQTLTLTSQLLINDAGGVTIDASGLSNGFTISGGGNVRLFTVNTGSMLTLKNLTLINGKGLGGSLNGIGGAIYNNTGATLTLDGCTLSGHSTAVGGAIFNNGGVLTLTRCAFTGNAATDKGGAVNSTGGLTARDCTFSGNTATSSGGALYTGGTASLRNCTFTANAGQDGGGVFNQFGGVLALTHCTLALNSATVSGGGIGNSYGAVTLANCIVAQNTAPSGADIMNSGSTPFGSATVTRVGVDIVRSHVNSGNTATDSGPTSLNADPLLNVLGNYGGPTPTMPLLPGSPALDQASVLNPALTTDQRGLPRPLGVRPDIGAVEGTVIVVTTPVDELDAPGSLGNGVSLREAVRDVEAGGTVVFDRAVFNSTTTNTITLTKGPLNPPRNCTLNGALNPGGIKIVQVPTITAQPQPLSVASNAPANFAIAVTNLSGGVAYAWRKNGTPNGTTAAALNFANAQEGDEGVYDVLLSEAAAPGTLTLTSVVLGTFAATSQPANLIVDGSAVAIKRHPANAMIALGSSHTLSVVAAGPGTLTYQWTLNGKNISGATKASYLIAKAALTHAGTYRCVVKSGANSATSDPAEIGVVDTTPKTVNLLASPTASFTATVNAAGNGITYAWLKNGGGTAFNAKSFVIKPAAAEHAGLYTCTVTGLAGTFTGGAPTRLTVSNAAPQIVKPLSLPPAVIGHNYFYQIPIANVVGAPVTDFTVGGLPPGMTWDKLTGIISGRPTAATKPLGYPLTIKVSNPKSSDSATATLLVNIVPASAVGVFAGPLERSPLNDNLGGRFDLTTTASGLCSGSLTLGGRTAIRFTNQLLLSAGEGDVILRTNIPGIVLADKTPLTAYVEVFATDQNARLTLVHPNGTTLLATAWRNSWSKTRPATAYAATYTARLDPANSGTAPRGYGFATLTVAADGSVKTAGKLPDGSILTQAGFVGPEGQLTLFSLLYANRGSLVGPMQITAGSPVANNTLGATLSWFKPTPLPKSTDTIYQAGFGPLAVTVEGSPYSAPAKGQRVMGLDTVPNPNAKLDFTLGGLAPEFAQLLYISNPSATGLTNKGTLTLPLTNSTKLTTLDAAKGLFTGSFIINGSIPALNRPAPFEGLIVRIGPTTQGYGYFLLPTATAKITTSPKLSGRVVLGVP
jgi:predicted outer membrane repeat protein